VQFCCEPYHSSDLSYRKKNPMRVGSKLRDRTPLTCSSATNTKIIFLTHNDPHRHELRMSPCKCVGRHWAVIPVVVGISGFFLGIEELATQMEEPFSILPMEKMCEGSIRISVMEQVERRKTGNQGIHGAQPVAPAAVSSGIPSTNAGKSVSPGSLSEQDMEKMELYFVEDEEELKGKAGNQGINGMSVDDMNKLWASQSGSKSYN
jgi:hypothetical protein